MIVFPMAGLSRRFTEAGYQRPKYMLEAHGKTLFRHAVEGFAPFFKGEPFLFIVGNIAGVEAFVRSEAQAMGIAVFSIVVLPKPTGGQADTVFQGLDKVQVADDVPITIFNIDTLRVRMQRPTFDSPRIDGYLEVFKGSGANWSFVRDANVGDNRRKVAETTEKRPISDLCCTGLYHFAQAGDFRAAFLNALALPVDKREGGELYVAPLYNGLIRAGKDIRYYVISSDDVIFCGVPAEYQAFLKSKA